MRIAYDHTVFSQQRYGGISRYFVELIRHLSSYPDISTRIYAGLHCNDLLRHSGLSGVRGLYLPRWRGTNRLRSYTNNRLVGLGCTADVCHLTYYRPRAPLVRAKRRVVTVYDMIHELFAAEFSSTDRTSEHKRHCVDEADLVIAISESTKRDIVRIFGTSPQKVRVIYLAADLSRAASTVSVLDKPYVLYAGMRAGYKNFYGLLRAYCSNERLRKNVDIVAFGGGPPTPGEREALAKLKIIEHVKFIQGDDATLAGLYRGARAFVYPSLYEGFGLPPLEAMSLDCPVVSANNSSLVEVVGDAGLLFNGANSEELAPILERIVEDEKLRGDLIARGRLQVQRFSWAKCAAETADLYRELNV